MVEEALDWTGDSEPLERNEDHDTEQNGDTSLECCQDATVEWNEGSREQGPEGVQEDDVDDEEGWITPENFQQACEAMGGALEVEPQGIAVGCVTMDFAMQVRRNLRASAISYQVV